MLNLRRVEKQTGLEWLPWARFNLHRNPFGELSSEERSELAVVEVDDWLEMLRKPCSPFGVKWRKWRKWDD